MVQSQVLTSKGRLLLLQSSRRSSSRTIHSCLSSSSSSVTRPLFSTTSFYNFESYRQARLLQRDRVVGNRRFYTTTPCCCYSKPSRVSLASHQALAAALPEGDDDSDDDHDTDDPYVSPFGNYNTGSSNFNGHRQTLRRRRQNYQSSFELDLGEAETESLWDIEETEYDWHTGEDLWSDTSNYRNQQQRIPNNQKSLTSGRQGTLSQNPQASSMFTAFPDIQRQESHGIRDGQYDMDSEMDDGEKFKFFLNQFSEDNHYIEESDDNSFTQFEKEYSTTEEYDMFDNNQIELEQEKKKKSPLEYLAAFDPQNPPSSDDLHELEIWLECQAQQEEVLRFQKVVDDARSRKDYSSLSMVQRQVVRWFPALQEEIARQQRSYILKEDLMEQENDSEDDNDDDDSSVESTGSASKKNVRKKKQQFNGRNAYGPYLCVLPPAKLAIIVAHEAIMFSLTNKSDHQGVRYAALAKRIGGAVEEEVVVHRLLHKRFKDAQRRMQNIQSSKDKEGLTEEGDVHVSTENISDIDTDLESVVESKFGGSSDGDSNEVNQEENSSHDTISKISDVTHKWAYASSHLKNYLDEISQYQPSAKKRRIIKYAIRRARQVLEKDDKWTENERIQLGAALFKILLEKATIREDGNDEMAFTYEKRWTRTGKTLGFVVMNDRLYDMIVNDKLKSFGVTTTRYKPMIVPPKPWIKADQGGYQILQAELMRFHGCNTQKEALGNADLSTVFDGLNALGRVEWKINKKILEVAQKCWENNIPLGDIPSRTDFELPLEPIAPELFTGKLDTESEAYKRRMEEQNNYRDAMAKYNRIKQKNMDLRSLRGAAILKLDQAEKFKDFEKIYFPYNMDFRGRAYPIPPHLSNVGSDLCRGILKFAKAKPLGERGLYWLKVHLANFAGMDKVTFDQRAAFVDDNMDKIRACVEDPFAGERWWMTLEDPFQGLACCHEVVAAIDSGDPASYMCSLAVHMDGSCNGLQHYAALGRDKVGGTAVNLCDLEEPQDVYVGVMHEVIKRVAQEAERQLDFDTSDVSALNEKQKRELYNNRSAKLVNGLIDRGVVKRTVMTSVYGVTYIGARQQIQEKIEDKLEAHGQDIDEINNEIFQACGYLAKVTMETIGDLFSGAKGTMNWLTTCARMISQHGYPVAWISPIGLPAIQPYRQKKSATLVTLLQTVTLTNESDDLPIHKQRQVSAFPPNYIHSLDSSHMLLTALEMDRRGLTFSAVHDSFWTHACDIDEMNAVLRNVFVDLYSQPLLESLKETWEMRYPDLEFPDLPERGELDLKVVRKAPYFFQ